MHDFIQKTTPFSDHIFWAPNRNFNAKKNAPIFSPITRDSRGEYFSTLMGYIYPPIKVPSTISVGRNFKTVKVLIKHLKVLPSFFSRF
jgi:hypothetical protein